MDIIFFEYPFTTPESQMFFEVCILHHIKTILWINDSFISSLLAGESFENHRFLLNQASYFIVPNETMKQWFVDQGVYTPSYALSFMDDLIQEKSEKNVTFQQLWLELMSLDRVKRYS